MSVIPAVIPPVMVVWWIGIVRRIGRHDPNDRSPMFIPSKVQTVVVMVAVKMSVITLVSAGAARPHTVTVASKVSACDMRLLN